MITPAGRFIGGTVDNFGDYLDEPEVVDSSAVSVFIASTFDEFGGLRRLLQGLPGNLEVPIVVHNLDDQPPPDGSPADGSLTKAAESDLFLLLLGSQAGPLRPGDHRTVIAAEYEAARRNGRDVLIYEQSLPIGVEPESRLTAFKEELKQHHTIGFLGQLSDALQFEVIHDRLTKWLTETGRTQQASALVALGDKLVVSVDRNWRDHRINQLDRWVMGVPEMRDNSGTSGLIGRADDEWNEAVLAFNLRAADVMKLHLARVVRVRPLDGKARFWLGRLIMTTAATRSEWKDVMRHIEVATQVHEQQAASGPTGLCYLVQAKCLRHLGDLDRAQRAVTEALERLDWHSEAHLEACYLELVADNLPVAEEHLYDAFCRFPPSFDFAEDEVADLDGGTQIYGRVRQRLVNEIRRHLAAMQQFEIDVGRAIVRAELRNVTTQNALRFTNGLASPENTALADPEAAAVLKPVGNNDGLIPVAANSDDPVRLANLAQSLSTLNHARLVGLEKRMEMAYLLNDQASAHHASLQAKTDQVRRFGFQAALVVAVVVGFVALIGQMTGTTAFSVVWLLILGLGVGGWWWNRQALHAAAEAAQRTASQLKLTASEFEELVGRYEATHNALRHYVPRIGAHEDRIWRLGTGSTVFTLVSNDALAPHLREAIGGLPIQPESGVRLYRATPGSGRSAQAERWRAYASDAAAAFDEPDHAAAGQFNIGHGIIDR